VLTSDLFDLLFFLLRGTKSDFLKEAMTLQERLFLGLRDKTAKLAESLEMTVQRNS
jgi:hypothetical protein